MDESASATSHGPRGRLGHLLLTSKAGRIGDCSLPAGLGLMRIWSHAMTQRAQPQLGRGAPLIITAAVIHGSYNAVAVVLDALDFQF